MQVVNTRIPVALLGATGLVGQRLVAALEGHPNFALSCVAASARSVGRPYGEAVHWRLPGAIPTAAAKLVVEPCDPAHVKARLVFSAIDAEVAYDTEAGFAAAGRVVVSNARSHRMAPDVPLLIPEINATHLELIEQQRSTRGWGGFIVTNPNCSTIGLCLALAPLQASVGIESVIVTTLQAISGAGYPGVSAMDLLDNVVPFVPGEEAKIESEPKKIFGHISASGVASCALEISSQTHRVPVMDGHLLAISLRTRERISPQRARRLFEEYRAPGEIVALPSSPERLFRVASAEDRPQPRLDRNAGHGMTVTVGRLRSCPVLDLRFEALSHNTVRGAAGGTLLIAELLAARGLLP